MTPQEAINTLNSIKQYYNDKNEDSYVGFDNEDNEALDMAIEALEQQPCEDWRFYYNHGYAQAKRDLLCDDCISREETLKYSHIEYDDDGVGHRVIYTENIEELPPVQPQRPKGKWIRRDQWSEGVGMGENYGYYYQCSECKEIIQGGYIKCDSKYCPNCGSYNGGEEEC